MNKIRFSPLTVTLTDCSFFMKVTFAFAVHVMSCDLNARNVSILQRGCFTEMPDKLCLLYFRFFIMFFFFFNSRNCDIFHSKVKQVNAKDIQHAFSLTAPLSKKLL